MTDFLLPSGATRAVREVSRATSHHEASSPPPPPERDLAADAHWCATVELDRYQRYLIPTPGGDPDELVPHTRVTTLTGLVGTEHGLTIWGERELLRGVGMRQSLRALLADGHDDKSVLDEVREAAKEASGMNDARRYGSAVHSGFQAVVLGRRAMPTGDELTEQYGRDVAAAVECLRASGMRPWLIERLVVHATLGYAGRVDMMVEVDVPATGDRPERTVLRSLDLKTGRDPQGKAQVMGAQLAAYANATHWYDPATRTLTPAEPVDRTVGYILAVRDGIAQMHEVELLSAWVDFTLAVRRHGRAREGTVMMPVGEPTVVPSPEPSVGYVTAGPRESAPPETITPIAPTPPETVAEARERIALASRAVAEARLAIRHRTLGADADVERSPSGRARRACSRCRQPGHTAKKCPAAADLDTETVPAPRSIDDIIDAGHACRCTDRSGGWVRPEWTSRPDVSACGGCGLPSQAALDRLIGERSGLDALGDAPVDRTPNASAPEAATPPWSAPPDPAPAQPSLMERIDACGSQEEIGALWQSAGAEWTAPHTARAQARIDAGLPRLPQ
jgi:hypothetical protein